MKSIRIHRHEVTLRPESARVIIRPFIPFNSQCLITIIGRALLLPPGPDYDHGIE